MIVEQAAINPVGQYRERLIFVDRDECIEGLTKLVDVIHKNDQVAVLKNSGSRIFYWINHN